MIRIGNYIVKVVAEVETKSAAAIALARRATAAANEERRAAVEAALSAKTETERLRRLVLQREEEIEALNKRLASAKAKQQRAWDPAKRLREEASDLRRETKQIKEMLTEKSDEPQEDQVG
jgi:predicted  nucleic acid-binding Zn-ribbon protein